MKVEVNYRELGILYVSGSRYGVSSSKVFAALDALWSTGSYREVGVGDACGVDAWVAAWCAEKGVRCHVWKAYWALYGKSAGVRRSAEMLADAPADSVLLAFCCGESRGTRHAVRLAKSFGIPVVLHKIESE